MRIFSGFSEKKILTKKMFFLIFEINFPRSHNKFVFQHDNNVYGVLVALGIPQIANTLDGWPAYAAGIFMEFHRNTSTNERFFKVFQRETRKFEQLNFQVLYREGDDTPISDVTSQLPICNGATLCPLGALQTLAETLKPLPDITTVSSCFQKFRLYKKFSALQNSSMNYWNCNFCCNSIFIFFYELFH